MAPNSDQNLLFGIIAMQMDFVRRDQLVAATSAWLTDKSRKIEEILVEQDAISEEDRQLLAPLVARHVDHHDGDPQKSLAALSSIRSVVEDLRSLGDKDIHDTLAFATSSIPDSIADKTVAHQGTISITEDGRFRILRPHAKGGLGEVFIAEDKELNREVAVKEIQTKYAHDAEGRSRFLLEAEVTGGLEHPGIVPVYGLGRYDDGRPFYAMRFIRGDSLREAARNFHSQEPSSNSPDFDGLQFRDLLGRFIDVCQAIEYAHSRGVLHRDIKPGNIMLGKYGETLVVDWGLARVHGRDNESRVEGETTLRPSPASGSAPTVMGRAIGTPAFMPPEQAAGNLNSLGPRSDVYSLGATLYYMLTGQSPFEADDVQQLLRRVEAGEFTRPRQIQTRIPKGLEAICLRAMANRPKDRYASPRELADDIERHLADEPVIADEEPTLVRVRRWTRKNPAKATAVLVGGLATILMASGYSLMKSEVNANRRVAEAREETVTSQAEAQMAKRRGLQDQIDKLEALGDLKGAIQTLEELSSMDGGLTDIQSLKLAEKYFFDQQLSRARDVLQSLDEASLTDDLLARRDMILGDVLYGTAQEDQGLQLLQRSLDSNQLDEADAAYVRGVVAATPNECMQELSSCLNIDPQNSLARVRLSMTQVLVGEPRKAIENARVGKLLSPEDWRFNIAIAFSYATMVDSQAMEAELESVEGIPEAVPLANLCRLVHNMSSFLDSKFERVQPKMEFRDVLTISKLLGEVTTSIVPALMVSQPEDQVTIPRLGWTGEMHRRIGTPSLEPMQLTMWLTRLSATDDLGPTINKLAELMPNSRLVQSFQMIDEITSRPFDEAIDILNEVDQTEPTLPGLDLNLAIWTSLTLANQEVDVRSNKKSRLEQIQDIQPWARMLRQQFSEREFVASEEIGVAITWGVLLKNGFLVEALDVAKSQRDNSAYPEDAKARWEARFELTEELQESYASKIQQFVEEATADPRFVIMPPAPGEGDQNQAKDQPKDAAQ